MSKTLTCPLCKHSVSATSSMCRSCHLPIKDVRSNQKPVGRHRLKGMIRRTIVLGVTLAVAVCAGLVLWSRDHGDSHGGGSGESQGIKYSRLQILNANGSFDGTLELANLTTIHANVYVTVHVYNGDQEVGQLRGDVSLKPDSSAEVNLDSFNPYDEFTDAVVELLPLPAAVG